MKKNHLYLLFTPILLDGCGLLDNNYIESKQNIVFEIQYLNYAWGYNHSGVYINKQGEIYSYKYDYNSEPWEPNEDNYYTEEELKNKFSPGKQLARRMTPINVTSKTRFIEDAMHSAYSDTIRTGTDMGAFNYICYYYDSRKDKYLQVILLQEGDCHFKKESAAADSLINWLKQIKVNY